MTTPSQLSTGSADDPTAVNDLFDVIAEAAGERLSAQIRFIIEIDKLKGIVRQTPLIDGSRNENDAEHTWHLMTMAVILAEFADADVDLTRALRMLLIHDLVEIDAGDTFLYANAEAKATQAVRERTAADRLFGLLPDEQGQELRALWEEFEAHKSADARFARTMDRLQPFLHNVFTGGIGWRKHGVTADQVRDRMSVIADGSADLHALVEHLIDEAVARGHLPAGAA
ncbi:HD domain-containing protein [Bauldia sp.]|uniref:HD domain-containing protein n=1 Tax=Bauldia sp. TaxID=2575872 RepID=UPI003BAC5611